MELKTKDIVDAVRERGLDWLFQTLYDNYCIEAEYTKPGQKPFNVRVAEVERLRPGNEKILEGSEWKYQQSIILMAADMADEFFKSWPKKGDRVNFDGHFFEVSLGYQFTAWFHSEQKRLIPAMRIFVKEIAEKNNAKIRNSPD